METKDKNGIPVNVGDTVLVEATVTDIALVDGQEMLSAVTRIPHGPDGKRYSLPVLHGSQIVLM
jgi:hypothetical protein